MKITRQQVYDKCNGHCGYCGINIDIKSMQVDHIIPQRNYELHLKNKIKAPDFLSHLTLNDLNHIDNLMPTCRSCNNYKSTLSLELFREEIADQPKRLRSTRPTFKLAERFGLIQEVKKDVKFYFELFKEK